MFHLSFLLGLFLAFFSTQGHAAAFYNKKGEVLITEDGIISEVKLKAYAREFKWSPTALDNIRSLSSKQRVDFARKLARKNKSPIYGPSVTPKPGSSTKQTGLPPLPQGVFSLENLMQRSWPRSRTPRNWIRSLEPTVQFYEAHRDKLSAEEQENFEYLLEGRIKNPALGPGEPVYPNPFDPNDRSSPNDDEGIE